MNEAMSTGSLVTYFDTSRLIVNTYRIIGTKMRRGSIEAKNRIGSLNYEGKLIMRLCLICIYCEKIIQYIAEFKKAI